MPFFWSALKTPRYGEITTLTTINALSSTLGFKRGDRFVMHGASSRERYEVIEVVSGEILTVRLVTRWYHRVFDVIYWSLYKSARHWWWWNVSHGFWDDWKILLHGRWLTFKYRSMLSLFVRLLRNRINPPPPSSRPVSGTDSTDLNGPNGTLRVVDMQRAATPKVDLFLRDVITVARHHGFSISHEDDGAFIIGPVNEHDEAWLGLAHVVPDACR